VALPDETRLGPPAFEHHAQLPTAEVDGAVATVLLGELAGSRSPARADTPIVGADIVLEAGRSTLPLEPMWEHALVVLEGEVRAAGQVIRPGVLAYQAPSAEGLVVEAGERARLLLLGGEPFPFKPVIWWNFVGRDRDEVAQARADWMSGDGPRFAAVASRLPRVSAPDIPW
jgi:redox-sensitive bicupin YhaK (pirin superfamily)